MDDMQAKLNQVERDLYRQLNKILELQESLRNQEGDVRTYLQRVQIMRARLDPLKVLYVALSAD